MPGAAKIVGTKAHDVIVASRGDNVIFGKGGGDTICAGAGDDMIGGGRGNDCIDGGSGADRAWSRYFGRPGIGSPISTRPHLTGAGSPRSIIANP